MKLRFALPGILAAALAAVALTACAGDDDAAEPAAATATATETVAATTGAEDGAAEDEPGAETGAADDGETEEEAQAGKVVDGDIVVGAAERTAAAGTARVSTSMTVGGDGVADQTFGGEGVFSFDDDVGEVTLDLGSVEGATVSRARVVFADYVVYYGLPPGFLAGNKRWLKLDPQGLADASAVDAGSLFLGSQADPAQFLLWLRAIGPTARRVGSEAVRGEETTRYDAVVDLRKLAAQGPEGQEDAWRAYVESTQERLGLAEIPVQVWVDGDGLVRRLRHGYVFGPEGEQSRTSSVTELWDFGVPVNVRTPPPGQVADLADYVRP